MRRVVEGAPRKKRYAVVSAAGDVDSYCPSRSSHTNQDSAPRQMTKETPGHCLEQARVVADLKSTLEPHGVDGRRSGNPRKKLGRTAARFVRAHDFSRRLRQPHRQTSTPLGSLIDMARIS